MKTTIATGGGRIRSQTTTARAAMRRPAAERGPRFPERPSVRDGRRFGFRRVMQMVPRIVQWPARRAASRSCPAAIAVPRSTSGTEDGQPFLAVDLQGPFRAITVQAGGSSDGPAAISASSSGSETASASASATAAAARP